MSRTGIDQVADKAAQRDAAVQALRDVVAWWETECSALEGVENEMTHRAMLMVNGARSALRRIEGAGYSQLQEPAKSMLRLLKRFVGMDEGWLEYGGIYHDEVKAVIAQGGDGQVQS